MVLPKLPPKIRTSPPFLMNNPNEASMIASWVRSNLDNFEVHDLIRYIHEELIDRMAKYNILRRNEKIRQDVDADDDKEEKDLDRAIKNNPNILRTCDVRNEQRKVLKENGLSSICTSTVYKWMSHLGFKNKPFEKSFRTNGHEKEENIRTRIDHVIRYLKEERYCYRWVRVPRSKILDMISWGLVPAGVEKLGRPVEDGLEIASQIEFHADTHEAFEEFISPIGKVYGGDLQFDFTYAAKPVLFIGQDEESSIESNTANSNTWVDQDGRGAIMRPKGR